MICIERLNMFYLLYTEKLNEIFIFKLSIKNKNLCKLLNFIPKKKFV